MEAKIVHKSIIPAKEGRTVKVMKGQTLRIIDLEGQQVADVVFYNANDYSETFSGEHSLYLNMLEGSGNFFNLKKLWSSPPNEKVMLTVTDYRVESDCVILPLHTCCSRLSYKLIPLYGDENHLNCADNLMGALKPYGVPAHLPDILNVFMECDLDLWIKGEHMSKRIPKTKPGDFVDFRAEMDVLVGISACPSDRTPTNGYNPTSLGVEIRE